VAAASLAGLDDDGQRGGVIDAGGRRGVGPDADRRGLADDDCRDGFEVWAGAGAAARPRR